MPWSEVRTTVTLPFSTCAKRKVRKSARSRLASSSTLEDVARYRDDPRFAAFCRKVGLPGTTDAKMMP